MLLWRGYKIYFYDEEDGRDYVGEFLEDLAKEDPELTVYIMETFFERIENGVGIPYEWTKGKNPTLKKLQDDLWEYRESSKKLRKMIRIYFGADDKAKTIVFVNAHFKKGDKDQSREIRTALRRFRDYEKRRRII